MDTEYILVEEEEEPKQTGKKVLGAFIAMGVLLGIWIAKDRLSAAVDLSPACVQVLNHEPKTDGGVTRIYGTLKNTCDYDFGTMIVFFRVKDGHGRAVGQVSATRRKMAPGESWDFETVGFHEPPSYEFDHITAR